MSKTVQQAIEWAVTQLSSCQSRQAENAKLDSELLLADVLGQARTWLRTWPEHSLDESQWQSFQSHIERRLSGEPVAYLLGHQDFWTLTLQVSPATLIPRPETEHLVESALDKIPADNSITIADLGTGSGAIALAIASERKHTTVFAVDVSDDALAIAEHNRQQYRLDNVSCINGFWLRDWQHGTLDMVVSNPPYVAEGDKHLDDLRYEPIGALLAEDNGLSDIKEIAQDAMKWLKADGWLMVEHGFEQGGAVRSILKQHTFLDIETLTDYAGLDRVTIGRKGKSEL